MSEASAHSSPHTILIVDDTPANLGVMVNFLERHGFEVAIAQDGEEGLQRAGFVQPDIILLDVMMPGIDGFETCRRLKQREQTRSIPVIFMTALTDAADKVAGLSAGGVDYVTKPFQIEEVLARINIHLSIASMQKQLAEQNRQLQLEVDMRRVTEEALKKSSDKILALYNNAACGYHSLTKDGTLVEINETELSWLGRQREEVVGKLRFPELVTSKSLADFYEKFPQFEQQGWNCDLRDVEFEMIRADGSLMPVLLSAQAAIDEEGLRTTSRYTVFDITERKHAEEQIRYLATHDSLTHLPNRALLQERIKHDIALANRYNYLAAIFFIDLDHFKQINDSLGHHVGDQLLQMVAQRLIACVRESDSVVRLGGDEFVLSLPRLSSDADATAMASKVMKVFSYPFNLDGHELHVTASVGISLFPTDGADDQILMRKADAAMYQAKEQGRNAYQFFSRQINDAAVLALALENSLHGAISRKELSLHYQPQVSIFQRRLIGAEALLRWRRDDGMISPAQFIPIAEKSGLIITIGEWVLREACRQNRAWQDAGYPPIPVSVNVSSAQFRQRDFVDMVARTLTETGLDARYLKLELTESILMRDLNFTIPALESLKSMGVGLSIDDFGTGYSSLSYLKRFPIDTLKIDQSFIRDITTDPDDATITNAIIGMAKNLKQRVIAEGVETSAQLDFLYQHGCDEVQGYYFSKPLTSSDFEQKVFREDMLAVLFSAGNGNKT